MSLWNPRKPPNQPPHFGRGQVQYETASKYDPAVQAAKEAIEDGKRYRRKRAGTTAFDKGTSGSR